MELEVRRHRIRRMRSAFVECVQRRAHRCKLLITATLSCQPRRLDFQADTQFKNRQHITQGDDGRRIDAKAAWARRVQHKGTDPVTGLDQTGGLQARDRLAHHRAADALLFHDRGFSGQFIATLELTAANTLG
ncbi:hypothetical protein ALO94_200740 [Pseudomonas syringae pv. spinaceae]|uniref:Uncharacterized protein n=1 Tax=Pseudomonas syringae pv. spinaceae TaxID=264459 RepID=A0A0Q0FFQ4_PSESX|nr:hypothetical protein ALO94_200740 [Pseudomonas syringae pv. spinaceae]